jgi:hypothetical protein
MKCVISDMKVGMNDLKIDSNETRLELADHRGQLNDIMVEIGYRKKHKKTKDSACRAASSLLWS